MSGLSFLDSVDSVKRAVTLFLEGAGFKWVMGGWKNCEILQLPLFFHGVT